MAKKFYGGQPSGAHASHRYPRGMKVLAVVLALIALLEGAYCVLIFSEFAPAKKLRTMYIETAMSTMRHQWLATYFIPHDIVDAVVKQMGDARDSQVGQNSSWDTSKPAKKPAQPTDHVRETTAAADPSETVPEPLTPEQEEFFTLFHELEQSSVLTYVRTHPEAVENGWASFRVNEAGLEQSGTTMETIAGDQVLAVDAEHQVVLVRVKGSTYRGVLAICKDPARLKVGVSSSIGEYGQRVGGIARNSDGLVAITANGFDDADGRGTGGVLAGACMSDGRSYGEHYVWGYKRLELHEDNRLYIRDAHTDYSSGCTDAAEFYPTLILDGEDVSSDNIFTALNPRACIGQTANEEILMLVVEGRLTSSLGTDAQTCAEILLRYDAFQALNMDGGTSAIMWYDGEYVTRCSNTNTPDGRYVPNAWVYCREPIED